MNDKVEQNRASKESPQFWIASEQYYPQETATGYLLTQLAEGLTQQLSIGVICGKPSKDIVGRDVSQQEMKNGVLIRRCATSSLNKNVLFFRMVNIFTQSISLMVEMLKRIKKHNTVLVVTNPPTLPFLALFACWLKNANYVLLIHDVYPEAAVIAGVVKADGLLVQLANRLNTQLYRNAQSIVVLGRDMRELVIKKLKSHKKSVVVIPNWAEVEQIQPRKRWDTNLAQELGLTEKFIIQYAGNMSRVNDLESIIQCADQLRDVDDLHFLFIGSGAKKQWLEQTVAVKNLSNVTILPNRPRSDQNDFLNACDVAIVSLDSGMVGVSVPSRTYNIMAAGKPIIGIVEEGSEVASILEEEKIGWVVSPGQSSDLVQVILGARTDSEQLSQMGLRARLAVERMYTLKTTVKKYMRVIEGLID